MKKIIIISLILILMLTACKPKCIEKEVAYQETEYYPEGYLTYEILSSTKYTNIRDDKIIAGAEVNIKNTDSQPGNFTIAQKFTLANDSTVLKQRTLEIMPDNSRSFIEEAVVDTEIEENINVEVSISSGDKIHTKNITKYKTEEVCE